LLAILYSPIYLFLPFIWSHKTSKINKWGQIENGLFVVIHLRIHWWWNFCRFIESYVCNSTICTYFGNGSEDFWMCGFPWMSIPNLKSGMHVARSSYSRLCIIVGRYNLILHVPHINVYDFLFFYHIIKCLEKMWTWFNDSHL